MTIEWTCSCGLKLKAQDDAAGKQTRCPKCSQSLVIPAGAQEPSGDDDLLYALADGPGVEDQAPRPPVCPFCGGSDIAVGTQVCRQCRRNVLTGVPTAGSSHGYTAPGEPTWFACWMGEIGRRIRKYCALLIIAGLLLGSFLFWCIVPAANQAKIEDIEHVLQLRFGGQHLHSLELEKPYFALSVPDEFNVKAVRSVRYGSASGGVSYRYFHMHGKYTPGADVLKLSGKYKEMTIAWRKKDKPKGIAKRRVMIVNGQLVELEGLERTVTLRDRD